MRVQSIGDSQGNNGISSPSFKSVRIFKDLGKAEKMGISIFDDRLDTVQLLVPGAVEAVLSKSKNVELLNKSLKHLGQEITENIEPIRELLKGIVNDVRPKLSEWYKMNNGKKYKLKDTLLDSLDNAVKKGIPEYTEKGIESKDSPRILCFKDKA